MRRTVGPVNPVSPHPNGFPGYSMNPVEDLPVAEWDFFSAGSGKQVYSSQALRCEQGELLNNRD